MIVVYITGDVSYSHDDSLSVTFPAGSTNVSFNISIHDDETCEDHEDFIVTIVKYSLPNHVTRGDPGTACIHIVDDDG